MKSEPRAAPDRLTTDGCVTMAVVTAISELSGQHPVDLDFCLADYVDPDALDALFAPARDRAIELTLTVDAYEVTVRDTGTEITVVAREGDRLSRRVVGR
jgi:hypothetical protein